MSTTTGPEKKPARRVRVIEIVDDEEVEETPAGESSEEDGRAEGEPEEAAGDSPKGEGPAVALAEAEAEPEREEPGEAGPSGKAEKPEEPKKKEKPEKKARRLPALPSGGSGRTAPLLTAAVVVLALLAGFALFQWRAAASAAQERKELVARISAFGDVMATYSFDDVESANGKAMSYLTGDALEERKKVDLSALREQLQAQKTKLKSTTYAVYVGSVDGNLASAVLVFDLKGESTALSQPQTISKSHLTLGLIKRDGEWMISSMVPAGTEGAAASTPGTVPSTGETPAPKPSESEKE